MLKLIRLEWKKNNVGKYIRNVVIMSALICMFIFALCYLGIANDPDTGVPDAAPGNSAISSSIELFTSMAFLVFTSVMLSTYIVSAYGGFEQIKAAVLFAPQTDDALTLAGSAAHGGSRREAQRVST